MPHHSPISILLADDDEDDCFIFEEVLRELEENTQLTTVNDGMELMDFLRVNNPPEVLFLDLNMPKKNGFECLTEIKVKPELQHLPVIIFSTSYNETVVNESYKNGALFYIKKPADFEELKSVVSKTLHLIRTNNLSEIRQDKVNLYQKNNNVNIGEIES